MNQQNRISAGVDFSTGQLGLWIRRVDHETHTSEQLTEDGWMPSPAPGTSTPPTLHLDERAAQELMEHLWANGVRPQHSHARGEHVTALEAHLKDMRTIAFARLKVQRP